MKRLYRSELDKKLGGVCGGIAEYLDADPTVVRLLTLALLLVTGCFPIIFTYLAAWWIVPPKSQIMAAP